MSEARDHILRRIAEAKVATVTASRRGTDAAVRDRGVILDQFAEYVAEYRASVWECPPMEIAATIEKALRAKGSRRIVVPADLAPDWVPSGVPDRGQTHAELAEMDAVVTECALGIAETGTIVLDAGRGQGRRAITLIPDHHVCVIRADQVVDTVPEAVALLTQAAHEGRPQTWISGPSATSDIELSRVEGVHGPRVLDVVLVRPA